MRCDAATHRSRGIRVSRHPARWATCGMAPPLEWEDGPEGDSTYRRRHPDYDRNLPGRETPSMKIDTLAHQTRRHRAQGDRPRIGVETHRSIHGVNSGSRFREVGFINHSIAAGPDPVDRRGKGKKTSLNRDEAPGESRQLCLCQTVRRPQVVPADEDYTVDSEPSPFRAPIPTFPTDGPGVQIRE
jgi:hypothetical protein